MPSPCVSQQCDVYKYCIGCINTMKGEQSQKPVPCLGHVGHMVLDPMIYTPISTWRVMGAISDCLHIPGLLTWHQI